MSVPNAERPRAIVGTSINRVDGPLKVTGTARYSAEIPIAELAYGVIVQSEIARGTIAHMDVTEAEQLTGVLSVMTPDNTPKLESLQRFEREGGKGARPTGRALSLLQDDRVHYNGQPIALVIADSFEVAMHAASLVRTTYRADTPTIDMVGALSSAYPSMPKIYGRESPTSRRGDLQAGLADADARIDVVYTTPMETHNPMEMHATIALWDGDKVTLWDATQNVYGVR